MGWPRPNRLEAAEDRSKRAGGEIEGAEVDLVANELDVLRRHVKHLLVETHQRFLPEGQINAMLDALVGAGFEITAGDRDEDWVLALVNRNL